MGMKDFVTLAKNNAIEQIEKEVKQLNLEIVLLKKNIEVKKSIIENMIKCEVCEQKFDSRFEFQAHIEENVYCATKALK